MPDSIPLLVDFNHPNLVICFTFIHFSVPNQSGLTVSLTIQALIDIAKLNSLYLN